jgi:hypothetical protein
VGDGETGRGGDSTDNLSNVNPSPVATPNPQSEIPGTPWVPQSSRSPSPPLPVSPSFLTPTSAPDDRPAPANPPHTPTPVPSCPLPQNFNETPLPELAPAPPSVAESIDFLDRLDRQRRNDRRRDAARTARRPSKTGNPILDRLIHALRDPPPNVPRNSQQTAPDSS